VTLANAAPAQDSPPLTRRTLSPAFVALAIVAIAAGVVLRFLTVSDLWLDEALTVNIAKLPWDQLYDALRHDGAPPLHYALLHAWIDVFGDGDVATRALSGVISLASLVALWFVARRIGGEQLAVTAVAVAAVNPFAIRYATEARMYALEILLVTCGILAVQRAFERPTVGRLAVVAVVTALLAYTQYWAFYLLIVTGVLLLWRSVRGPGSGTAHRVLVAVVVGCLAFVPWLPAFFFQVQHTGTPWGAPSLPGIPIGVTLLAFSGEYSQEGWLALLVLTALALVGAFAVGSLGTRVQLDLRSSPEIREIALVGASTLVVGVSLAYLGGTAFQPRYGAVVLPFFVLVVARGITMLGATSLRIGALALVIVLGVGGGVRNVLEQRTQAGAIATVLRSDARAGDVVVYCPDQLGPAVHRVAPPGLDQVTYPALAPPLLVDWVDYEERLDAVSPTEVAGRILERAGGSTIWLVRASGYRTHQGTCEQLSDAIGAERARHTRVEQGEAPRRENMSLEQFSAR
jgi:uncharacterized membrane protein